ncbi:hypothetical protein HOD30_00100 [Candidatus Peregrinibacteria bacterium]|jgi:uridine kinase|nr:hypothetical protein [Candidatus Peregrinibacteria bacterium]MBT4632404.1 hypothetical protein [Candidatus Peregrinibacteria bacterium]MBT5517036.1 hypothetical protein [Candidatus Peregrinibacteria bacterium]MBT5823607.1 hypothetical protein [Candidatus Peregrinibacteria bacterium]
MKQILDSIAGSINTLDKPIIIGISGFGGSGKSTVAIKLGKKLNAPVVGIDSFSKSNVHEAYELWKVMDYSRLEKEVLTPFTLGEQEIAYNEFDWEKNSIGKERSFKNRGVLIVEGVGLLRPELMQYFSYTIWVDCPIEEATERGKKRDREEYNCPQDEYWEGIWQKNDLQCFEKFSPKVNADYILDNSKQFPLNS